MSEIRKKGFHLIELDPMKLEIHELAQLNPLMPNDQYVEFVKKFEDGFKPEISHVVLYKGKVVDGRHRTKVCKELGIKLWARNLPSTTSTQEVEEFVAGTEARRHQTATQRAIGAYKYYMLHLEKGTKISQEVAATAKLSTRRYLARAADLHKLVGMDVLDQLHNGEKLRIRDAKTGKPTTTDALQTLINYFTKVNEDLVPDTKVNTSMTDAEIDLAEKKLLDIGIECNMLVQEYVGKRLLATVKDLQKSRKLKLEELEDE